MIKLRIGLFVLIVSLSCLLLKAQDISFEWRAGIDYFFDNTEFARSSLTADQTMSVVRISPELGLKWSDEHHLLTGFSAWRNTGSTSFIDGIAPMAYYFFEQPDMKLYAGIFPRGELLSNYSDFLFQDSVGYYVPSMQGLFWQIGSRDASFFNLWLDWTGKQSLTQREAFFLGASGYKDMGLFFVDFQSYMFHLAKMLEPVEEQHVCDNLQTQLSAGLKWDKLSVFDNLILSAGALVGFERERGVEGASYTPIGFVAQAKAGFRKFGIDNRLYIGEKRMNMYEKFGNLLYWGNPFLRSGMYFQSRLYWQIFNTNIIKARLASHTHYSEGEWMFEQVFTLQVALN